MISCFDYKRFRKVSQDALVPAAEYIRGAILGEVDLSQYLIKGDKTAVTIVDRTSEDISRPIILGGFPELSLRQEETKGVLGNPNSPIKLYHDPLDGTGGFLMGGQHPQLFLQPMILQQKKFWRVQQWNHLQEDSGFLQKQMALS